MRERRLYWFRVAFTAKDALNVVAWHRFEVRELHYYEGGQVVGVVAVSYGKDRHENYPGQNIEHATKLTWERCQDLSGRALGSASAQYAGGINVTFIGTEDVERAG